MSSEPQLSPGTIYADERPTRRAVSISSVDSEPIARQDSVRSAASSTSDPSGAPGRGWTIPEGEELPDEEVAEATMPSTIPVEQTSEAPVAVVHSTSAATRTCVAEALPDTLSLGAGTRLCLSDGNIIGYVMSVLGPVRQAFYLVKVVHDDVVALLGTAQLTEGTELHYDLAHEQIMYDPFGQCDAVTGTDASYINDEELPEHVRPDFSDDDKEIEWKRQKRRRGDDNESISSDESHEEIEWSKMDLDGDGQPPRTAHVMVSSWHRSSPADQTPIWLGYTVRE